jgi:gluconokinase
MIYVVMGVSGCGKTSVGEAIARHLGLDFVEGDALHPGANVDKMSKGIPLDDADRFPWLDRIGGAIATALADNRGLVVSCSSLKKIYRDRLRGFASGRLTFIFLKGSEDLLTGRMAARKGHFMPVSLLQSQLATLEDPSEEDKVITVDITGPTADVIERALAHIVR